MSMTYNIRQAGAVTVIDVGGRISLDEAFASDPGSGGELHKLVREMANHGHHKILLNLRDVTYVDSSGIGELFGCFTTLSNLGGALKLARPIERVQNLLNLTKLNTVIEVVPDEAAAVQAFAKEGMVSAA